MKELFEKLEDSGEYKRFKEEYPDAYFCTAFFVFGGEAEKKEQLNYSISDKEVMSFDLAGEKVTPLKMKTVKPEKAEEIKQEEIKISPEQAKLNLEKHVGKKFSKLILVLQRLNGEVVWNITCMDGFNISRFHVSATDGKIQDLKGFNIRDMMKVEKKDPKTGEHVEMKLPDKPNEEMKPAEQTPAEEQPKPDYVQ